jgi:hypothetical protein
MVFFNPFPCFFYLIMALRMCCGPAEGGNSPALPLEGVVGRRGFARLRPGGTREARFPHLSSNYF